MGRPRRVDQLQAPDELACDERVVHLAAVQAARRTLPTPMVLEGAADVFGALADPTRLRIVAALASRELCVCDLAATLGLSESAISHQLRVLRNLGLARARREGRLVYYTLDDEHVSTLFAQALEHVGHRLEEPA